MHSLDAEAEVRKLVPGGVEVCDEVARRKRHSSAAMVDTHQVRCSCVYFMTIERGIGIRDHRPCVRVGGGFAGRVSGFEFFERRVDVVEVEGDHCLESLFGVDLANLKD